MHHTRYPPQQHPHHTKLMVGPNAPHVPVLTDDWIKQSSGLVSQYQRLQACPLHLPPPKPAPFDANLPPMLQLQSTELADFASSIVYLMWCARRPSIMLIHRATTMSIDNNVSNQSYIPVHEDLAAWNEIASSANIGFKKYCRQLLDATRLSESVVLLALKFVAKLLQRHPCIHGAEGSEYRLFTVALMLGNKYLDDNTFTNASWSHISGMSKIELQIMEFEFLDVVDYRLCVNKYEFQAWKEEIVAFHNKVKTTCQARSWEQTIHLVTTTIGCSSRILLPKMEVTPPYNADHQTPLLCQEGTPQFRHEISNNLLTRVPLRSPIRSSLRRPFSQVNPRFAYQSTHPQTSKAFIELSCARQQLMPPMTISYSQAASSRLDPYRQYYKESTNRIFSEPRRQFAAKSSSISDTQANTFAGTANDQQTWQSLPVNLLRKPFSLTTTMRTQDPIENLSSVGHYSNAYRLPPLSTTPNSLFFKPAQLTNSSEYIPPIPDNSGLLDGWSTQQRIPVDFGSDNTNRNGAHSLSLACYGFPYSNDGGAPLRQLYNAPDIFHLRRQ